MSGDWTSSTRMMQSDVRDRLREKAHKETAVQWKMVMCARRVCGRVLTPLNHSVNDDCETYGDFRNVYTWSRRRRVSEKSNQMCLQKDIIAVPFSVYFGWRCFHSCHSWPHRVAMNLLSKNVLAKQKTPNEAISAERWGKTREKNALVLGLHNWPK